MLLKFITIFNWLVVAVLAILVAMESLFPTKGGDAAGRGIGQALYYLAIIALVVLLILNLVPHRFGKFAAFGLVAIPTLLIFLAPTVRNFKRGIQYKMEDAKSVFEDKTREEIFRKRLFYLQRF